MQASGEVGADLGMLPSHLQSKENDWLQLGPLTVIRDIRDRDMTDRQRGDWPSCSTCTTPVKGHADSQGLKCLLPLFLLTHSLIHLL